jgi:hypothetical protein
MDLFRCGTDISIYLHVPWNKNKKSYVLCPWVFLKILYCILHIHVYCIPSAVWSEQVCTVIWCSWWCWASDAGSFSVSPVSACQFTTVVPHGRPRARRPDCAGPGQPKTSSAIHWQLLHRCCFSTFLYFKHPVGSSRPTPSSSPPAIRRCMRFFFHSVQCMILNISPSINYD